MQLPVGMNDPELEERIIQHLAAAAAMGRTHHITRREGSRSRLSGHGRPQFVVLSTHPNASSAGSVSASPAAGEAEPEAAATTLTIPSSVQSNQLSPSSSGYFVMPTTRQGIANDNRNYASQSSLPNQDRAGPSEFQSFSDTWKSRFNAMSMKYKESISKNTRGWKEKLFSRSSSMADIGSEVRREVNAGIATVSRMMERLEASDNNRADRVPLANNLANSSVAARSNQDNMGTQNETLSHDNNSATIAASSISN
ncbi:E3 ubiquitin-protein ligase [Forsythia ovata]|uniref:E3 ubiquitin-protein ligase n=1 Tax=Forsythia ovata TaxID=205694 RepID=A0ABD1WWW8_9LAMI